MKEENILNEEEFKTKYDELITSLENKGHKPSYEKIVSLINNMRHDSSYEEILSLVENMGHESSIETKKKEKKSMTTKKMTMRKLRLQQRWVGFKSFFCTRKSLILWSALVAPAIVMIVFMDLVFTTTLFSAFMVLMTITILELREDRDKWKRSYELNRALLEKEKRKKDGESEPVKPLKAEKKKNDK
jgi:hypothetical protein